MSLISASSSFGVALRAAGWSEITSNVVYEKGAWRIVFDTSSWMEVGTLHTPRIFDVPVPEPRLESWTLNLIEHLCAKDDQLRQAKT
jgi:hypothetical protein